MAAFDSSSVNHASPRAVGSASNQSTCSLWRNRPSRLWSAWSTGDACGLQHTKSWGSRTSRCSAARVCMALAQEAGCPPTFGSVGRLSFLLLAMWIMAMAWTKAR